MNSDKNFSAVREIIFVSGKANSDIGLTNAYSNHISIFINSNNAFIAGSIIQYSRIGRI